MVKKTKQMMTEKELAKKILARGLDLFEGKAQADEILLDATILIQEHCEKIYHEGYEAGWKESTKQAIEEIRKNYKPIK